MKNIELTQGHVALVDDEDYERVNQYLWQIKGDGNNVCARGWIGEKKIYMHRFIMNLTHNDKQVIDHIDHDGLNNKKANLRICDQGNNMKNRLSVKNSSSCYKGISWNKRDKIWNVAIKADGRRYYIGIFKCEIEAAKAYNKAALKHHGEFAKLNIIGD